MEAVVATVVFKGRMAEKGRQRSSSAVSLPRGLPQVGLD